MVQVLPGASNPEQTVPSGAPQSHVPPCAPEKTIRARPGWADVFEISIVAVHTRSWSIWVNTGAYDTAAAACAENTGGRETGVYEPPGVQLPSAALTSAAGGSGQGTP